MCDKVEMLGTVWDQKFQLASNKLKLPEARSINV